jgi:hypothetical protein
MPGVLARSMEIRKVLLLTISNLMILYNEMERLEQVTLYKKRLSEVAQGFEGQNIPQL